jgi:hypothetical protein
MSEINDKMKEVGNRVEAVGIPLWLAILVAVVLVIWCIVLIRRYFKRNSYDVIIIKREKIKLITQTEIVSDKNRTFIESEYVPLSETLTSGSYKCSGIYSKAEFLTKNKTTLGLPFQNSGSISFFVYVGNDKKYNWNSLMNTNYSHIMSIQQHGNDILVDQLDRECKFTDLNVNRSLFSVFLGNVYNELIITMRCSTDGTDQRTDKIKQWQKIMKLSNIVTIQSELDDILHGSGIPYAIALVRDSTDLGAATMDEDDNVYGEDVPLDKLKDAWKDRTAKCGFKKELDVMVAGERLPFNKWTHIALNVKDKNVDLYVNGQIYKNFVFNEDTCLFKSNQPSPMCLDQVFAMGLSRDEVPKLDVHTNTGYPILFRNNTKIKSKKTSPQDSLVYFGISDSVLPKNMSISRICYTPESLRPDQLRMLSYKNPDSKMIHERIRDSLYNWSNNITSSENNTKLKDWFKDRKWNEADT